MDSGEERIADDEVLRAVRAQARRVQLRSVAGAVVLTALFLLIS